MEQLSAGRRKRIAICMCVLSASLMGVVTMGRHHLWVSFVCIGVEVLIVVLMMREVAAAKRDG